MILETDRDIGYTTVTVRWTPSHPDIAAQAFEDHGVSDGDHLDREKYKAVRNTYAELMADTNDE